MNLRVPTAVLGLVLCPAALAQTQTQPPGQGQAPRGTQQMAPVPKPGERPVPQSLQTAPTASGVPVNLTLEKALQQARIYSQQVYTAAFAAQLAHEDAVQARAAL